MGCKCILRLMVPKKIYRFAFYGLREFASPQDVGGQAMALGITGDQAFEGRGFYGAQDTLLDERGRQYFRECFIAGSIDFIFVCVCMYICNTLILL